MTSLLKEPVVSAINKQVVEEFSASLQYIAIAFYFESETLPELAKFFHLQADEEHEHAMKLLNYLSEAGAQTVVPATYAPQNQFSSAVEAVSLALQQEIKVTDQINALVDTAINQNDHLTRQFLQWFVTEQLEEVSSMNDLLTVVKRAGDNLLWVEDYLVRNPHESEREAALEG